MTGKHKDVITWSMVLKKAPMLMRMAPRIIKGFRYGLGPAAKITCGVAWTFEQAVKKNPDGVALLYENRRFTYTELNEWSNRIAHYLLNNNVKKGDSIAIFMENRPEFLACVLAVSKIGAISALINTSQSHAVLKHSFTLAKPKLIIVGEELLTAFEEIQLQKDLQWQHRPVYFFADCDTTKEAGKAPPSYINLAIAAEHYPTTMPSAADHIFANDTAFYLYTSGTTGLPKAGIYSQGRWMKSFAGFGVLALNLGPKDVLYSTLPLYHATALCVCWSAAISGAAGFAIRRRFSATNFWRDVRKYNATAIAYVGELCRYLLEQPAQSDDQKHFVRKMIGNGLRPNIWHGFKERFGIREVYEIYGASDGNIGFCNLFNFENTVGFSTGKWAIVQYDKIAESPVRNNRGFMQPVSKGEQGLLIAEISDKSPLDGYTDSVKTNSVIYTDVFSANDRWFNTGDILRNIGFGHAQFVDRVGDTFRWKGENVSTTEVENIIAEYPQIYEAVVYGVNIPNTEGKAGMAAITLAVPLSKMDFGSLCHYLVEKLPTYGVPIFLRIKTTMETTATFKYFKARLKQENYDLTQAHSDTIYVRLPGTMVYSRLTEEILFNINAGNYKF